MQQRFCDTDPETMTGRLLMTGSGYNPSTADWWPPVSDAVITRGPKNPPTTSTNGTRANVWGYAPAQGQYILHCVGRSMIKMARTIKCLRDRTKWHAENIEAVRVSPYDMHSVAVPGVVLQERPVKQGGDDQPRKKPTGRKIYIKGENIRAYGYTQGCPGCDHERRYGPCRTTKGHSEACRIRIMGEL